MKILVVAAKTGGHVFPGCCLASHLAEKNFYINIMKEEMNYTLHLNLITLKQSIRQLLIKFST